MEFNDLSIFVRVVQTGSFTRAALALGSQKAYVSRVITQLEAKLGVRLLERTTRSLSLTEVGREMFERAVGILGAVDEAKNVAQQLQGEPRGLLKLTCGVEMGMIAVNQWISRYLQLYPQVSMDADYTNRLLDIVHEGFDLAIRVGKLSDSSLAARKLGDFQYGLFAAPGYMARHESIHSAHQLRSHALIMFTSASQRQHWDLSLGDERVVMDQASRLNVNNIFAARDAAIAGLGVTKLPLRVAQDSLITNALVRVLPNWQLPSVPIHAIFPSTRYLTPKVRKFIDLAVESFEAVPAPSS